MVSPAIKAPLTFDITIVEKLELSNATFSPAFAEPSVESKTIDPVPSSVPASKDILSRSASAVDILSIIPVAPDVLPVSVSPVAKLTAVAPDKCVNICISNKPNL